MNVDFNPVIVPVLEVVNAILWPLIAVIGAIGTIYCIFLGIKVAKADEQNSREKAKKRFSWSNNRVLTNFCSYSFFKDSNANIAGVGYKQGRIIC